MLDAELARGATVGAEGDLAVFGEFMKLQGPERLVLESNHWLWRKQSMSEVAWDGEPAKACGGKP